MRYMTKSKIQVEYETEGNVSIMTVITAPGSNKKCKFFGFDPIIEA